MPGTDLEPPFQAYSGNAPFIFVSYSHSDAATVFRELVALRDSGYRLWFDEGIDPGHEWPEEIAKRLREAAMFLVFLSPAAVASRNVRNEIHLALHLEKDFLAVHLSETKLPPGLELSLNSIQAIFKFRMSRQNYWRKVEKVFPAALRGADLAPLEIPAGLRNHEDEPGPVNAFAPVPDLRAEVNREFAINPQGVIGRGAEAATAVAVTIYHEGLEQVAAGVDVNAIRRGILKAVDAAVDQLGKMSRKLKDLHEVVQVATTAADGDTAIGGIIGESLDKTGRDGIVHIREANSQQTVLEAFEGIHFRKGYLAPELVTKATTKMVDLKDCCLLILGQEMKSPDLLRPVMQKVLPLGRPLLSIALGWDQQALKKILLDQRRRGLEVVAVEAPAGDSCHALLEDIAIFTGGQCIAEGPESSLVELRLEALGHAKRVLVDREATYIIEGMGKHEEILKRVTQLRQQIEEATTYDDGEKLRERLAMFAGATATIHVGGATTHEKMQNKETIQRALRATRDAIEEGVVPGNGMALLHTLSVIETVKGANHAEQVGVDILRRAVESPFRQLARKARIEAGPVIEEIKVRKFNEGYSLASDRYEDLFKAGVVEAKKVVRLALQKGASVAAVMLARA